MRTLQSTICLIVCYFGPFPNYFPLFLESCAKNPTVNWLIFTDNTSLDTSENVKLVHTSFSELKKTISSFYDFKIYLEFPINLCNYKVAYGEIFEAYLTNYSHWGYCDIDVIFGDIRAFITEDLLNSYDKILRRGHFTLFRNAPHINRLYRSLINGERRYQEVFQSTQVCHFDEGLPELTKGINHIFALNKINVYDAYIYMDLAVYSYSFINSDLEKEIDEREKAKHSLFIWKDGKLYRVYLSNGAVNREEFMYIHFQKRKMNVRIQTQTKRYNIVPNAFVPYNVSKAALFTANRNRIYLSKYWERLKKKYRSATCDVRVGGKILQVLPCLARGGTEAYVMNLYRHIDKQYQFDFVMFTSEYHAYDEEIKKMGGNIYYCGVPSSKNLFAFFRLFISIIKNHGPFDAVHAHANILNGWIMLAAKLARVPTRISHSHDTSGKAANTLVKKFYIAFETFLLRQSCTKALACSKMAGDYLYGEAYFQKRGTVSHNGIDLTAFLTLPEQNTAALRKEFSIPDGATVFGNITRFENKKNTLFTIKTFKYINQMLPQSILLLGGPDGGLLDESQKLIKELDLESCVRLIGERSDIPACLSLMDAYLFPSLYEGLGFVLLESQAMGVKCFISSTTPKNADMGLGLCTYLDLEMGEEYWGKYIVEHLEYNRPSKEQIVQQFRAKQYDVLGTAKLMEGIYGKAPDQREKSLLSMLLFGKRRLQ